MDNIPTFAEFIIFLSGFDGWEIDALDGGTLPVLWTNEDMIAIGLSNDAVNVAYAELAPYFNRLIVQRFLPLSLMEETFGEFTPLVASLFLQLDGVRYEVDTDTLFWFVPHQTLLS